MRASNFPGLLLLVFVSVAFGQTDRHLMTDSARNLYQRSAYAHGYIHGYEDGFHDGDIDVHMGRGERPVSLLKDYRNCDGGYQRSFGDKKYFQLGYRQGFREAYSDSIRGGQFRAIDQANASAAGMEQTNDSLLSGKEFDQAFSAGYNSGRDRGFESSRPSAFDQAGNSCEANAPHSDKGRQREYCDVFMRGFSLGFGDGQAGRVDHRTQTAKK